MPSAFEADAVDRFEREFLSLFGESVVRRMGGRADRTEVVTACVDFDEKISQKIAIDVGGLIDSDRGQYTELIGLLDVKADQVTTPGDEWVIREHVYRTHGEQTGEDAGSKTIIIHRRVGTRARAPRTVRK